MYSTITLLLTALQALIIAGSIYLQWGGVFLTLVVYGSPFHLMMNMLSSDSALVDKNPIYLFIFVFHILKYFFFFKAQMIDDGNWRRTVAILLEAAYLALTGYYLN